MLTRAIVAAGVFLALVLLALTPTFIVAFRGFSRQRIIGLGLVAGSTSENLVRLLILVFLALLAFWISGKLVNAA